MKQHHDPFDYESYQSEPVGIGIYIALVFVGITLALAIADLIWGMERVTEVVASLIK